MQDSEITEANRTYHQAQSQMELLPGYYSWMYGYFARYITGCVIELGCGAGMGIATYLDRVDCVYAVDHNEQLLRRVRTRLPGQRVVTIQADLRGDWAELRGLRADTVILMDVIEHFPDDAGFLQNAAALLIPGGHLAIKVPAQSAAYSEMDRASGHFRRYDPERMLALAKGLELEVVWIRPINRIGGFAYRFRSQRPMNFSRTFSAAQLRAINVALPVIRMFDLLPGLPGLSLGVVLRRSA